MILPVQFIAISTFKRGILFSRRLLTEVECTHPSLMICTFPPVSRGLRHTSCPVKSQSDKPLSCFHYFYCGDGKSTSPTPSGNGTEYLSLTHPFVQFQYLRFQHHPLSGFRYPNTEIFSTRCQDNNGFYVGQIFPLRYDSHCSGISGSCSTFNFRYLSPHMFRTLPSAPPSDTVRPVLLSIELKRWYKYQIDFACTCRGDKSGQNLFFALIWIFLNQLHVIYETYRTVFDDLHFHPDKFIHLHPDLLIRKRCIYPSPGFRFLRWRQFYSYQR